MSAQQTGGGIGFFGLLAALFIALKLLGKITWSWWWVTAPIWGPLTVALTFGLIALVVVAIYEFSR